MLTPITSKATHGTGEGVEQVKTLALISRAPHPCDSFN